ncbi:MAG: GxxExxY protein [Candidatus Falkowbacteria bacterium]
MRETILIYPELSYKIVGILFSVFNNIGGQHYEKNVQRAIAIKLEEAKINYQQEVPANVQMNNKTIGQYRLDFLIEGKIILEIKRGKRFAQSHFNQLKTYINTYNVPIGILAIFTETEVRFARIVNFTAYKNS